MRKNPYFFMYSMIASDVRGPLYLNWASPSLKYLSVGYPFTSYLVAKDGCFTQSTAATLPAIFREIMFLFYTCNDLDERFKCQSSVKVESSSFYLDTRPICNNLPWNFQPLMGL